MWWLIGGLRYHRFQMRWLMDEVSSVVAVGMKKHRIIGRKWKRWWRWEARDGGDEEVGSAVTKNEWRWRVKDRDARKREMEGWLATISHNRRVEMGRRWSSEMELHLDAPEIRHWECRRTGMAGSPSASPRWCGWHGGRGWWSGRRWWWQKVVVIDPSPWS